MAGTTIKISCEGGECSAYLAAPAAGRGAGIVVIQEIFGVNAIVRAIADSYAARGYFALAPDLFWRLEPDVQLTDKTQGEWQQAIALMNKCDVGLAVKDIQSAIATLRKTQGCTGKIGAVGYCLGGLLAYLTAARTDADASVSYYGVNIPNFLAERTQIKRPLMMHIAGKDQFVPPPAQKEISDGLKGIALVTMHIYPEQDHAFAREGGEHYDKQAADLANTRSLEFFAKHLREAK